MDILEFFNFWRSVLADAFLPSLSLIGQTIGGILFLLSASLFEWFWVIKGWKDNKPWIERIMAVIKSVVIGIGLWLPFFRFSGNYVDFFVAVKRKDGNISWKSSDTTWAIGACKRYITMMDEMDRNSERSQSNG